MANLTSPRVLRTRAEVLAACARKARFRGWTTLTIPLTAVRGQGSYEIFVKDALLGQERRVPTARAGS